MSKIQKAFESDQQDQARQLQLNLVNLSEAIELRYGIPGLKYAMDRTGMYGGLPRRPLMPIDRKGKEEIDQLLDDFQNTW